MLLGRQVGAVKIAPERESVTMGKMFQHNVESFKNMWKEIGEDVGVPFAAEARLESPPLGMLRFHQNADNIRRIYFTVRRL
jgi:hypothetical protein